MRNIIIIFVLNLILLNSQTLDVKKGWNLYGAIDNIPDLSTFKQDCVDSIFTYDKSDWNVYPKGNLNTINKGHGFWVDASKDCQINTSKMTTTFNAQSFYLANCAVCHGDKGQGSRFRSIKGNPESWYLSKLTPFQNGTRTSPSIMSGILNGFDKDNLSELTKFLATL